MKIKKFTAPTEAEAIAAVRADLGEAALILNIKTSPPQGFLAFLRRPSVELTAAYEENAGEAVRPALKTLPPAAPIIPVIKEETDASLEKDKSVTLAQMRISLLERELEDKEAMLQKAASMLSVSAFSGQGAKIYDNRMVQVFYDALTEQGVAKEIASEVLREVSGAPAESTDLSLIVKVVYGSIINILGKSSPISPGGGTTAFFLGPTGVGKTTTIAKLSSGLILNARARLGLITADTYRIAAVEQLKVYAEILGIDLGIAYEESDLAELLSKMRSFSDIILIDTAGRSHKNKDAMLDLEKLLSAAPEADKYLVLSLTTKYEDLVEIARSYSEITEYKIIFTKADETEQLGGILNVCWLTGRKVSYITDGQNVPDDIRLLSPEETAKTLLGLGGLRND
ncbi:MAG: flagellar biosynthesis protein FlhF [Clostridiales bacterium]|nr:flagellar biosynthesis protein FlhF [Clostridiales bacterium]